MKRSFIMLSVFILSCMDFDDKSTTHRYTFKNKTLEPIIISDESDSPKPVFPNFVIPPDEIVTIEYTCQDCPYLSFDYTVEEQKHKICICNDGTDFLENGSLVNFAFGYCPAANFNNDQDRSKGKCSRCKTPDPCLVFGG